MTDSFEALRRAVAAEVNHQRKLRTARDAQSRAHLLGAFLQMRLDKLGRTREQFARMLDLDPELADGLLDGLLPLSELDDALLAEIARAVRHDVASLRILAGRTPRPAPASVGPRSKSNGHVSSGG